MLTAQITGEPREIERLTRGSEGGRWKSTHRGNSLAAYPTASTVLNGGMRKCAVMYRALSLPNFGSSSPGAFGCRRRRTGYEPGCVCETRLSGRCLCWHGHLLCPVSRPLSRRTPAGPPRTRWHHRRGEAARLGLRPWAHRPGSSFVLSGGLGDRSGSRDGRGRAARGKTTGRAQYHLASREGRRLASTAGFMCIDHHRGSVPPPRSAACGPAHLAVVAAGRLRGHPGRLWHHKRQGTVATPCRGDRPTLDAPPCHTRRRVCAATAGQWPQP